MAGIIPFSGKKEVGRLQVAVHHAWRVCVGVRACIQSNECAYCACEFLEKERYKKDREWVERQEIVR